MINKDNTHLERGNLAEVLRIEDVRPARRRILKPGVEAACQAASILDFDAALPDGYETMVGEPGYRPGGGETQRLHFGSRYPSPA